MKIEAAADKATKRVQSLLLTASEFADERALTFLFHSLNGGREITIDIDDGHDFVFSIDPNHPDAYDEGESP